jgi:hypothetical protein
MIRLADELDFSDRSEHSSRKELTVLDSAPRLQAENTAVQRLLVQQPVQQGRRTSAYNNNTLWTIRGRFKHGKDMGKHRRTRRVESPLWHTGWNRN